MVLPRRCTSYLFAATALLLVAAQRFRTNSISVSISQGTSARSLRAPAAASPPPIVSELVPPSSPPRPPVQSIVAKNCSCILFRHLAKTGGSTVQTILRRHEQIGGGSQFYYASHGTWVEIRPHEWNLLSHEIIEDPDGFIRRHPRLLVAFHKQSASQFPPQSVEHYDHATHTPRKRDPAFRIWEDITMLRKLYRERGCSFTLGVLLREPSSLYYSDYLFEGIPSRKPFAEFMGQDIQSSALLGWPFGWNSKRALTPAHRNQTYEMLDQFDLVGLTERFDESLLLLARDGGLPWPMYRRMNGQAAGFTNLGASSAASLARMQKQRLIAQPGVLEAAQRLTSFDREVYEHYKRRFEARLESEGRGFASLVKRFLSASQAQAAASIVDYGGCDTKIGQRGGPQRLDELKSYVPCSQANCTKIAADDLACKHAWGNAPEAAAVAYGGRHPFGRAAPRTGGSPDAGSKLTLCPVESAPDGFF